MNVSELKKCDTKKPYIFISYSSKDADVVWADVKEFQRRGYNVWLDECNLDKTKESWKDDAIEAIKKTKCRFLVFYVSGNSLESRPCLNEMMTIKDEETKLYHGEKDLPFITVDVEEIGDITTFKKTKIQKLIDSDELEEEEIQSRLRVVNEFIKVFFNNSNERVRIKPKCNLSRAKEYYSDIIEFFPKEARIYDEQPIEIEPSIEKDETLVEKSPMVEENTIIPEQENIFSKKEATDSYSENSNSSTLSSQEVYFLNARAIIDSESGYYILKKGSIIVAKTADSCPDKAKRLREESLRNGELVARGIDYELMHDKVFKSASGAATYVCGYSVSGTTAWKDVPTIYSNYEMKTEFEDPFETSATSEKKESTTEWDTSDLYATKTKKSSLPEMIQEGKISAGAELYVKGHNNQIATLTADGKIAYQGNVMSLNQFVLLILGPGSRNAYLFVYEKESGLTLNELRDGADVKKKAADDFEPIQEVKPSITDATLTIGDIRRKLTDRNTAFALRQVREGMPRGGKGAMDYAMAAILGGCNSINANSPVYQINYYTYAVADFENKKEDGGLGATWTWSSNCRKVLGLEKAGQIPTEIDVYFKYLSENTSLKEIEDAFYKGIVDAYQTKKNDMVMYAIKKIYEFFA